MTFFYWATRILLALVIDQLMFSCGRFNIGYMVYARHHSADKATTVREGFKIILIGEEATSALLLVFYFVIVVSHGSSN